MLYYARGFFLPLILALLITLAFMPLVRALSRRGIPPVATAILVVAAIGARRGRPIPLAGGTDIADAGRGAADRRPSFAIASARQRGAVAPRRTPASRCRRWPTGPTSPARPQKVVIAQPGIISWAADTVSGIGATLGATLLFVVFLLSSGDLFLQKLVRILPTLSDKKRSLRVVHDVESEVSRYLFTITLINAGFGAAVGICMAVLGMPNPVLWGGRRAAPQLHPLSRRADRHGACRSRSA